MESSLSDLVLYNLFLAVGFLTSCFVLTRWLLKEFGEFIQYCRQWNRKYWRPVRQPRE